MGLSMISFSVVNLLYNANLLVKSSYSDLKKAYEHKQKQRKLNKLHGPFEKKRKEFIEQNSIKMKIEYRSEKEKSLFDEILG